MPKHKNRSAQYVCGCALSRIFLSVTPSAAARLASLTMGFSRQEHQHFLLQGIFPTQRSHLHSRRPLHWQAIHTTPSPLGLFEIMNCPLAFQLHGVLSACSFVFWPRYPQPGSGPTPPAVEVPSSNHWTTTEVPECVVSGPPPHPRFCAFLQDAGHTFSCFSTMPGTVLGSVIA